MTKANFQYCLSFTRFVKEPNRVLYQADDIYEITYDTLVNETERVLDYIKRTPDALFMVAFGRVFDDERIEPEMIDLHLDEEPDSSTLPIDKMLHVQQLLEPVANQID